MMRKIFAVLVVWMTIGSLFGCQSKAAGFNATVLEADGNVLLVEPEENTDERKSCDKIVVGLSAAGKKAASDIFDMIKAGDIVCITYSGEIMETYPGQISADNIVLVEAESTETGESETGGLVSLIRVNGELYYDTGRESTMSGRCGVMDGEIDSTVAVGEIPVEEHQSNFGVGYGFQYAPEDRIEVYIEEQWRVFEKYQ